MALQRLFLLLTLLLSASLPAQLCPFCGKPLTSEYLCPDLSCQFHDNSFWPEDDSHETCTDPLLQPLADLSLNDRPAPPFDACLSAGACPITMASFGRSLGACQPKATSALACPWLHAIHSDAIRQFGASFNLDGCRQAARQQDSATRKHRNEASKILLDQKQSLTEQTCFLFDSPHQLLFDLTTWEWSEGHQNMVETHYFYLFEINALGVSFFMTDDIYTFGTHFNHPGRINHPLHLVRAIEKRISADDRIVLFIYLPKQQ